jgi:hypothetical protein
VSLLAVVLAGVLISVDVQPPPEQRGIGVRIRGLDPPGSDRGFDPGFTLSMAVELRACDEPVEVRITLAPTAEFWIDNYEALRSRATVRLAIPDDLPADAAVEETVRDLEAWTGTHGLAPLVTGVPAERFDVQLQPTAKKAHKAVFVEVVVPQWGELLTPLTVRFVADWTRRRSFLGGCYVTLPAVAGLPTVLSSRQLAGQAYRSRSELPTDKFSIFVVSSDEAGLYAYHKEGFEIARGVTSLALNDYTLQEGATFPAPDTNFGSDPAWVCRSFPARSVGFGPLERGNDARDIYLVPEGVRRGGTVSFSARYQEALLSEHTCASFVAVEAASAGTRRDLLLIGVGTALALAIELLLSGVRRRARS